MNEARTLDRAIVLRTLKAHKEQLIAKYGITRLGVFGSVAREQATAVSDVDIVVEMPPDLFMMVHLRDDLDQLLGTDVDLIRLHTNLNDTLRKRIDKEAIYV